MRQWIFRLSLSLMVVVGFWTSRLPAQDVFVVPATPYVPAHHPRTPPAFFVPEPHPPAKHAIGRFLNMVGMSCAVDPFYPVCGNAHYEFGFVFGSCRYWLNESCPPMNHGAGNGAGNGAGHGGRGDVSGLGCWMGFCNKNR